MGIGRMCMAVLMGVAVLMRMAVVVGVAVVMRMAGRNRMPIRLAGSGALALAEGAAFFNSLHVVVMTLLGSPDVLLEAQNLGAVFAE